MIGSPPYQSKDQDERDEDCTHSKQAIHDNRPRIPDHRNHDEIKQEMPGLTQSRRS